MSLKRNRVGLNAAPNVALMVAIKLFDLSVDTCLLLTADLFFFGTQSRYLADFFHREFCLKFLMSQGTLLSPGLRYRCTIPESNDECWSLLFSRQT